MARRSAAPWLVLAAALLLTAAATTVTAVTAAGRDRVRFAAAVSDARNLVESRMQTYVTLLDGAAGLFAASDSVTAASFQRYVASLDMGGLYPGVQGVGYSVRVAVNDTVAPDGARPEEEHRIVYIEPLDARNRAALGFDMFSEPVRRAAMRASRDRGRPVLSGRVVLVQEIGPQKQPGFLIYVPVYRYGAAPATPGERRAMLLGFVYSPFRAADLFRGIFARERDPLVSLRVYDGPRTDPATLLYDSRPPDSGRGRADERARAQLRIAERVWTLDFESLPAFDALSWRTLVAPAVGVGGLIVSLLLFLVTRLQVEARAAAEASEASRTRFFASLSHELRTPIGAVTGYLTLLVDGTLGPLTETQRASVERARRAARHLLELVNDVLDMSKLAAGKMELRTEEVALGALIEDLLATVGPLADERGVALHVAGTCDRTLHTDAGRVRQILLNLLSNAVKFGAGRPVTLACDADDASVTIAVRDEGPGIAPADLPRIFEEFVQLPNAATGGTGLGLPISRRLATLLGGRLDAESRPGQGSTFRLTLPVAGRPGAA